MTTELGDVPAAGQDLESWRRLDWRLLLPTAPLARFGMVAWAGSDDPVLARALPLVADRVRRVGEPADWAGLAGTCDLVVLAGTGAEQLTGAVTALRPGGVLYAEVVRRVGRGGQSLPGWLRSARRAGLAELEGHWHAPDLARAARVIPLSARGSLTAALLRYEGIRGGRLLSVAGRTAVRLGLFGYAVAEGSLTGRRPVRGPG